MRSMIFAVTLIVSTVSFGKGINEFSPAYLCKLTYYHSSTKRVEKTGVDVLIYPGTSKLFESYSMTTEENQYFQLFIGEAEVQIEDGLFSVSFDNRSFIEIDEKTGKGSFKENERSSSKLFNINLQVLQEGKLENCERLSGLPQTLRINDNWYQARRGDQNPKWISLNE